MLVSVPLEQRGSPACLPLPLPAPCPANRIVSLGDSSAVVAVQVVPSCGRVSPESQSSDDSDSSMTCRPAWWSPVSCRCVSDSDELRDNSCLCSRFMDTLEPLVMSARSSVRTRAQCSRKIMSDKGRKCRHTLCQTQSCRSLSCVDSVSKPEMPYNVIDVLQRDLRTVCVPNVCSDLVQSAMDSTCSIFRTGKCSVHFRFSMQRFCSALLCGLVLLTALRPQLSMAAPASSSYLTASKDTDVTSSSKPDVNQVLNNLKLQTDYTLNRVNTKLRNQFCVDVLYLDKGCPVDVPDYHMDIGAFKFKEVPKKLGETVENDHFDDKVEEALQNTHHNFKAYMIALQKLIDNQIPDEANVSTEYANLRGNIGKLLDEMQGLMKLRGVQPPADIVESEVAYPDNTASTFARILHWGILVEAMNGVEYFSQLLAHLSSRQQSTRL